MMRILHICQRDDVDVGGSLRVAEALVREQLQSGDKAWLLFLYGAPSAVSAGLSGHAVHLQLASSRQAAKGIFRLRRSIRKLRPQVIHMHDGLTWPRLVLLACRIPVITHAHLPSEWWQGKPLAKRLLKMTTDCVVGVSKHTCASWENAGFAQKDIRCIYNGVDFDRFRMVGQQEKSEMRQRVGLPIQKKIFLWVGRLHREMKGTDRLEHFLTGLPDCCTLVVVGNGPEYHGMQTRCAKYIRQGTMKMVGSSATPEDYYKTADVFLFTSYYEPFGLVLLEAVASGLPVLAYPVTDGGAEELLNRFKAHRIEDHASREKIRNVIEEMITVAANLDCLGRKDALSEYAWSSVAEKITEIYCELTEPSSKEAE